MGSSRTAIDHRVSPGWTTYDVWAATASPARAGPGVARERPGTAPRQGEGDEQARRHRRAGPAGAGPRRSGGPSGRRRSPGTRGTHRWRRRSGSDWGRGPAPARPPTGRTGRAPGRRGPPGAATPRRRRRWGSGDEGDGHQRPPPASTSRTGVRHTRHHTTNRCSCQGLAGARRRSHRRRGHSRASQRGVTPGPASPVPEPWEARHERTGV